MKISKLFHTLYAFLMFLPVMVLPLFAININQKEVEPLTAQIETSQLVDFNQRVKNGNFQDDSNWNYNSDYVSLTHTSSGSILLASDGISYPRIEQATSVVANHVYYYSIFLSSDNQQSCYFGTLNGWDSVFITSTFTRYEVLYTAPNDLNYNFVVGLYGSGSVFVGAYMCIDFTQMFGTGNEPTIQQFKNYYPNVYYQYTLSSKDILYTGFDTLTNTDVGSQFLYSLYNPLHDYFNIPNYMNLGGLYNWFLANLFSGYNTPVYFIIFTLMLYWLALSLLWLIFDVLMYVPSMIHKMLDKARME